MLSTQFDLGAIYPAGLVRVGQLALALVAEEARPVPDAARILRLERQLIDLYGGMEVVAATADPVDRDKALGYLNETYGLLAVGIDPLLRAQFPAIGVGGAVIHRQAFYINGGVVLINGKAGYAGAVLSNA